MSKPENHPYDDDNIFAKILRDEIPCNKVYEDDYILAFHDINPRAKVHVLVIPKGRYVSSLDFFGNAASDEIVGFTRGVASVCAQLNLVDDGYRIISNHGQDGRQEVPHMHLHILGGQDLKAMVPSLS